jgi:hypothetical protein
MNKIKLLFQVFLILVFLAGIYVLVSFEQNKTDKNKSIEKLTNKEEAECPDLLVKKGDDILLYHTKNPSVEPIKFSTLEEYKNYLEKRREQGIYCPVLFLQHEYDKDGKGVYREAEYNPDIKRDEKAINSTLSKSDIPLYNPTGYAVTPPVRPIIYKDNNRGIPIPIIDASRENGDYNKGNYAGFDPTSFYVGKYTDIDKIHDQTSFSPQSDNPMDTNWGGVAHTQNAINSGKYEENNITKPRLFQPKLTYNSDVPNSFPSPKDII